MSAPKTLSVTVKYVFADGSEAFFTGKDSYRLSNSYVSACLMAAEACMKRNEVYDKSKISTDSQVFVNCPSHRSREKMFCLLCFRPQCYYRPFTVTKGQSPYAYAVPAHRVEELKRIKGITVCRVQDPEKWHKCLPTGNYHG